MAFNPQLYSQARPDLKNNWQNAASSDADPNDPIVAFIRQFPSFDAYIANDFQNNPNAEAQQSTVASQPGNSLPNAASTIGSIQSTPVQTSPTGFADLVSGNQPSQVTPPEITPPTIPNAGDGNFNQSQVGTQAGSFDTRGNTQQTTGGLSVTDLASLVTSLNNQKQTSGGTSTGTTSSTGTQQTTGNTASSGGQNFTTGNTGLTTSTGTTTTTPNDTLGFGALLKGQAPSVQATDTARQGFLTDVMNTGGQQFNSQMEQAVRRGISGPGLTGAGDSARSRAAGYAGAEVARTNMDQRLGAAGQLSGPTGLATLSTAANPYIGQTQTSTGTQATVGGSTGSSTNFNNTASTGTTTSNGTSTNTGSTTGFSDLVGSAQTATNQAGKTQNAGFTNTQDTTTGSAGSSSGAAAAGNIPEGKTVSQGGGGCIVCTAGIELGLWRWPRVLRRAVRYKTTTEYGRFSPAIAGYFFLFVPFVRFLLSVRWRWLARFAMYVARLVVYEELRISKRDLPFKVGPCILHWTWHWSCALVGRFLKVRDLRDPVIIALAKKYNVFFTFPTQ